MTGYSSAARRIPVPVGGSFSGPRAGRWPGAVGSGRAGGRTRAVVWVLGLVVAAALVAGYLATATELMAGRAERQAHFVGHRAVMGVSDLFPRWYGARALLGGHSPYGAEFTAELQRLLYGRSLAPSEEIETMGAMTGFFYPPYVVLPLLPVLWLPFEVAQWVVTAALGAGIAACAVAWARVLGGARRAWQAGAVGAGALAFFPTLDLLWLQQLSGLVVCYLAAAHLAAVRRRYFWAGVLLGLGAIKPHLIVVPAAGLLFWSLWRRERWPLAAGLAAAVAGQLLVAELLLPGWLWQFAADIERYPSTNSGLVFWLPKVVTGGNAVGALLLAALPLLLLSWCWWRVRALPASSAAVLRTAALGIVVWAAVMPSDTIYYNRTMLLFPIAAVWLAGWPAGPAARAATLVAGLALAVPVALLSAGGWMRLLQLAPPLDPVAGKPDALIGAALLVMLILPFMLLPAAIAVCGEGLRRRQHRPSPCSAASHERD